MVIDNIDLVKFENAWNFMRLKGHSNKFVRIDPNRIKYRTHFFQALFSGCSMSFPLSVAVVFITPRCHRI